MGDVIDKTLHNILGTKHTKIHGVTSGGKLPKPTPPKKEYFKDGYNKEGYFTPGYKGEFFNFSKTKKRSGGKVEGEECQICGKVANLRLHSVALSDYGKRSIQGKRMCPSCIKAEERGEL